MRLRLGILALVPLAATAAASSSSSSPTSLEAAPPPPAPAPAPDAAHRTRIHSSANELHGYVTNGDTGAPMPLAGSHPMVGIARSGQVEVLTDDQGNRITPSYLAFTPGSYGERLVDNPFALPPSKRPDECPPCNPFNCVLPAFSCLNNGQCNSFNGQCICPPGFGGEDCSKPLCGSLADGSERYPREGESCDCKDGWTGINCNVCETDEACEDLIAREPPSLRGGKEEDDDDKAVCYKEGYGVKEMYQMCDVTNRKILDMLPNRPPQVTFTCDMASQECGFQFWIGRVESFYCGLQNCTATHEVGYEQNSTEYRCEQVQCACIPGRMLCGENGSVDITDFLAEEIKGPGKFTSRTGESSRFEEPAMNQLINDVFGDTHITIDCKAGECLRRRDVPGFVRPPKPNSRVGVVVSVCMVIGVLLLGLFLFWYLGRGSTSGEYSFLRGRIRLPTGGSPGANGDAARSLVENHIPAALQFSQLSYDLPSGKRLLEGISGSVQPGEIMAVLGASGAGKSTFLDLLARKDKRGTVSGEILVNGRPVSATEYRRVVGFVDQEDTLMGTLTVYETVLYSALLRLPRDLSFEDKRMRTLETMHELGILGIRDSRVGESGARGISGGEKRRVSIACELVTSPSILFLDEPTSGLDSYNAYNVVESLVQLAKTYERTVVFTIHQPQSNIVALFDKLVLLASGRVVYSGRANASQAYFERIGCQCPPGFNIADYLIDITAQKEKAASDEPSVADALIQLDGSAGSDASGERRDPEMGVRSSRAASSTAGEDTELETRNGGSSTASPIKRFFSSSTSGRSTPVSTPLTPELTRLVDAYASSSTAQEELRDIATAKTASATGGRGAQPDELVLRNFKRATWWSQFKILSGRAFKNLYRDPMLMLSHYAVAVLAAGICAFLFRGLTLDIPGFQNRMGMIFFALALFGFGCLTTLAAFSGERLLFTRERANGYYNPLNYFAAKLLCDVIPLRVIPAFVFGAIVYAPVGLVPEIISFWRFILVLVLFNLAASSVVLLLSILIKNSGVANLVGSLVMLFNLLFAGLLINKDKLPWYLQWLETCSFFHAAFEALLVNEVRYLQLKDHRYGVDIEVPAAAILSMFGFRAQAFWFPDVTLLAVYIAGFTVLSYLALALFVRERR